MTLAIHIINAHPVLVAVCNGTADTFGFYDKGNKLLTYILRSKLVIRGNE